MTPSRQRLMKSIIMLVWVMTPSRQRARDGESASSPASVSLSARPKLWRRRVRSVGLVFKPLSGVCWPQRCRPAFFFSLFEVKTYLCCCCNCVICLRHYQKQSGITFWMTRCLKKRSFFAVVLLWLLWILPRNPLLRGVGHSLSFRAAVHRLVSAVRKVWVLVKLQALGLRHPCFNHSQKLTSSFLLVLK